MNALFALAECVGVVFDDAKGSEPGPEITLLGADLTVEGDFLTARISEAKRAKYIENLRAISSTAADCNQISLQNANQCPYIIAVYLYIPCMMASGKVKIHDK